MRTRRWVLVIALIAVLSALVIYHGWKLLDINERTKNYLLEKIRPALGKSCAIERLDVTLGAIHLRNVELHLADDAYSLTVKNIRVGFDLLGLIKSGFRPQRMLHDVMFIQPHLTIYPSPASSGHDTEIDSSLISRSFDHYWEKAQNFSFINRITVSRGSISYVVSPDSTTQLGYDINGWLSLKDVERTEARLVGKLFRSPNYNLIMTGSIDLLRGRLALLNVQLNDYEWKDQIPFLIPDYFAIHQGVVNGNLSITENKQARRKFDMWGELAISDGAFQITNKKLFFDEINVRARLQNWNCTIDSSTFLFNGSKMLVTGEIRDIFDPQLSLYLTADAFDIHQALRQLAGNQQIPIKGISRLSFYASNSFTNPTITGAISCPRLTVYNQILRDCETQVTFKDSVFQVTALYGLLDSLAIHGDCRIDFSREQHDVRFRLNSLGTMTGEWLGLRWASWQGNKCQVLLQGSGAEEHISGTLAVELRTAMQSFRVDGGFSFFARDLSFWLHSPTHLAGLEGRLGFADKGTTYRLKFVDVHHVLYAFPELKFIPRILACDHILLQLDGDGHNWSLQSDLSWLTESKMPYRSAKLMAAIASKGNQRSIDASFHILSDQKPFDGSFRLLQTPENLTIRHLEIENIVNGNGSIALRGDQKMAAKVKLSRASLAALSSLILGHDAGISQGSLNGQIEFSGTLIQPQLNGELQVEDAIINQIGVYDAALRFQLSNHAWLVPEFIMTQNSVPILNGQGRYDIAANQLTFDLAGQNMDIDGLVTTIFNKPRLICGRGSAILKLEGDLRSPRVSGNVELKNGKLGPFAFDRMYLDLGSHLISDTTGVSNPLNDDRIVLERFLITRVGQFEIRGQGEIPYAASKPMNIELNGNGNILSLLPELTSFFKRTASNGQWSIHLGGRPNNVSISSGQLALNNGYLRLNDVAQEIKNIAVDLQLEQDGFLNVKSIAGTIKGRAFTFRNQRSAPVVKEKELEPFQIPELGLNFGYWTVATTSKGVPLRIPGLMEKGELGEFSFSGKRRGEPFFIAGPWYRPVVCGKIRLDHVNFTFPFLVESASDSAPSPVVAVLKSIDWDVETEPGKDLHYQRQIPSGVDNVYVDLIVDPTVGGVEFRGVIDENSFAVVGVLESSRGTVEYLDLNFQIVKAGVEFDMGRSHTSEVEFDRSTLLPIIYGEARTTVTDSTGFPYYIYMTLLTVDKNTGQKLKRGRLGEVVFELSSDNPNLGDTEGELLASLGYSPANLPRMATNLIGISADNLIFRPLFRPFERQLERTLKLDMVRFSSRFTRNLIEMNLQDERNFEINSKLFLLRSTKLMIGKYIADRLFLMYTGQLEAGMDYRYQHEGFGFRHTLGFEYRINPNLLLQMEYDYNSLLLWQKEDKKILLRHSFPF
ncbi:MAG: translocation/assembly module TamB [candidate division KSB1 bacterium]|nr:translocation/assembly module TamB [candidate division KSB1 bacterium]